MANNLRPRYPTEQTEPASGVDGGGVADSQQSTSFLPKESENNVHPLPGRKLLSFSTLSRAVLDLSISVTSLYFLVFAGLTFAYHGTPVTDRTASALLSAARYVRELIVYRDSVVLTKCTGPDHLPNNVRRHRGQSSQGCGSLQARKRCQCRLVGIPFGQSNCLQRRHHSGGASHGPAHRAAPDRPLSLISDRIAGLVTARLSTAAIEQLIDNAAVPGCPVAFHFGRC